jgi:hypothetical protein
MKALQLSSIAFAFLCLFNSCTKDSSQVNSNDQNLNSTKGAVSNSGNPNTGGAPGQGNPNPGGGNNDVQPTMAITYSPLLVSDPPTSTVGTEVTVTGSLTGDNQPGCGQLQLQQNINGSWVTVKSETVTATTKSVVYKFTPDVIGTYQFELHYVPGTPGAGNCTGYAQSMSAVYPLLVVEACNGLDITGRVDGVPQVVVGTNQYQFKVVYEVTTCGLQFDKLKIQGGLTNATTLVSAQDNPQAGVYDNWVPGGSTNWIQRWVETSTGGLLPTTKRTYTIIFQKQYPGSGTIELTGDWSVSLTLNGTEVGRDSFAKIYYTN